MQIRIRLYKLRFIHHEPMSSVAIRQDNDGDSVQDYVRKLSCFELRMDLPTGISILSHNALTQRSLIYDILCLFQD